MSVSDARPLVFATRNRGKLVELRALLPGLRVLALDEAEAERGITVAEVIEDAPTFVGNARKKALATALALGWPALADDSGLEVDQLGGAPGVFSARWAGGHGDDAANNRKLLAELDGVRPADRSARFRCSLVCVDPAGPLADREFTADGVCEGSIALAPAGGGGFGYDPLFVVNGLGRTFAELTIEEKSQRSHRGRAMQTIAPLLRAYMTARPMPSPT